VGGRSRRRKAGGYDTIEDAVTRMVHLKPGAYKPVAAHQHVYESEPVRIVLAADHRYGVMVSALLAASSRLR
jgi:hypothetical protein